MKLQPSPGFRTGDGFCDASAAEPPFASPIKVKIQFTAP